ncbi:MAG: hypothetical protein HKN37_15300 [Rhodothermales bacterium]|nr:hypothetical protein [Rhodothermales bacterium]
MRIRLPATIWVVLLLLIAGDRNAAAQGNRVVTIEDWPNAYIERLQRRGHMTDLNPTDFPYREREIVRSMANVNRDDLPSLERIWFDALAEHFSRSLPGGEETVVGGSFTGRLRAADGRRLDPLRPIDNEARAYQAAVIQFYGESRRWIAHFGLRHDWYYDRDPDAIDTANRLFIRSEDAYVGYGGKLVSAYVGRYHFHWAPLADDALFISSNPRSFDAIDFRIGGRKVSLRSIFGELDSITADGRYTGAAGADSVLVGSERRLIVAHRIDWRPSRHFQLTALESTIFSGSNTSLSPRLLNPAHGWGFESDNRPKNDENNGLLGGLVWMNFDRLTIHGQLLIDDVDLQGTTDEPWSYALAGSIVYAGIAQRADIGFRLTLVASRTFNADQVEGQYIYVNRGIATQFSDYVHGRFFGDIYLDDIVRGLSVSPRFELLRQGEFDMRDPFPDDELGSLLTGTIEDTYRGAVRVYYQPSRRWWVGADLGVNHVRNAKHIDGAVDTRFSGMLTVGARVSISSGIDLWN